MDTVCAVVVTYNRKKLLLECLEALRKQTRPVQGIYLIDNASTDGTPKLLLEKGYIKELSPQNLTKPWEKEFKIKNLTDGEIIKLHYVRMHENTGGAGGFYEGVKGAYEKGYDWLWLMDDDAEPEEDCLYVLYKNHLKKNFSVLCPLIIMKDGRIQFYHHKRFNKFLCSEFYPLKDCKIADLSNLPKIIKLDANAFVGPLIHKKVVQDIGFPKKELFIWGDDTEYTLRISQKFDIYLILNAFILHKDGGYFFTKTKICKNQYWKVYHAKKNIIYICKRYCSSFSLIYQIFRTIFSFIKNFDKELYFLKIKGIIDGFKL